MPADAAYAALLQPCARPGCAIVQLAAKRTELLVHVMPDAMRSNKLLLSMHVEELYVEQQKR